MAESASFFTAYYEEETEFVEKTKKKHRRDESNLFRPAPFGTINTSIYSNESIVITEEHFHVANHYMIVLHVHYTPT